MQWGKGELSHDVVSREIRKMDIIVESFIHRIHFSLPQSVPRINPTNSQQIEKQTETVTGDT